MDEEDDKKKSELLDAENLTLDEPESEFQPFDVTDTNQAFGPTPFTLGVGREFSNDTSSTSIAPPDNSAMLLSILTQALGLGTQPALVGVPGDFGDGGATGYQPVPVQPVDRVGARNAHRYGNPGRPDPRLPIDARDPDAKRAGLRNVHRGMGGEILSGTDANGVRVVNSNGGGGYQWTDFQSELTPRLGATLQGRGVHTTPQEQRQQSLAHDAAKFGYDSVDDMIAARRAEFAGRARQAQANRPQGSSSPEGTRGFVIPPGINEAEDRGARGFFSPYGTAFVSGDAAGSRAAERTLRGSTNPLAPQDGRFYAPLGPDDVPLEITAGVHNPAVENAVQFSAPFALELPRYLEDKRRQNLNIRSGETFALAF